MKKVWLFIGILIAGNILLAQSKQQIRQKSEIKIDEFKDRLELTEDQIIAWKEMKEKYRPELKSIRADESKGKGEKMRATADIIDKQEEELSSILSEDQFAELLVIREEVKKKRAERRKNRKKGN